MLYIYICVCVITFIFYILYLYILRGFSYIIEKMLNILIRQRY